MDPIIFVGDFHRCHASYIALMFCLDAFRSPCSAPPDGEGIPKDKAVGDLVLKKSECKNRNACLRNY